MDEKIKQTAVTPRQLSDEELQLVAKYTEAVIAEDGSSLPIQPVQENVSSVTTMSPPDLVNHIYHMQPEKRLLIVTNSELQRELASTLCKAFSKNHPVLYCNGLWEADEAIEEMRALEARVNDADGNILSISEELVPGIFLTKDGSIVVSQETGLECDGKSLQKTSDNISWGTLLPSKQDMIAGTADTAPGSFFTRTLAAANLMQLLNARKDDKVPSAAATLVFHDGTCLTTEWIQSDNLEQDVRSLFFQVLFGAQDADRLGLMLTALQNAQGIPETFVNDMERIYLNDAPASLARWNNLFERLVLDYQEQHLI